MMYFINNSVPVVGMLIMFIVMLTHRIDTKSTELGLFFASSMGLWVFLLWADWTKHFVPVWQTVSARVIVLFMVLCIVRLARRRTCKSYKKVKS